MNNSFQEIKSHVATCLPIDIAVCSWHYRLEDKLVDRLADKSFRRLSASLYSVDAQRDVPMLEYMADIFTNSILPMPQRTL